MICFEDLFLESGGQPVNYNGTTFVMKDDFPLKDCRRLQLVFESCNGEWRQGAYLCVEGNIVVNQQVVDGEIALWEDTAPEIVELVTDTDSQTIEVRNIWDIGDGVMHSWHNGAAMIVEELPNGRRYLCNDGEVDDDCDDIVFRLERLPL